MNSFASERRTFGRRASDRAQHLVVNALISSIIVLMLVMGAFGIWVYSIQVDFDRKLQQHGEETIAICRGN